jgi:hypothetical protein
VINGSPPAGVTCALGGAQSVHSRGMANTFTGLEVVESRRPAIIVARQL